MRGWLYNATLLPLTAKWYRTVLERIGHGAAMLDVGIGTGGALAKNAALIRRKSIRVTGVDIDADYVKLARRTMWKEQLAELVDVQLESIYDHAGGPYDAAYFSASFMLMPDPGDAVRHVSNLLRDDGLMFFTQTFQDKRSVLVEKAKPMLGKLTTVEFGQVTYEEQFVRTVEGAGLELLELTTLSRSGATSSRLAVGRPR